MNFRFDVFSFIGQQNNVIWFGNFIRLVRSLHYEGCAYKIQGWLLQCL
jgi:hypothetical protein